MEECVDMLVCRQVGAPYEIRSVILGDLYDDEILVRIRATGLCHTDFACCNVYHPFLSPETGNGTDNGEQQGTTPVPLPLVGGHEGAGVVEKTGSQVTHVSVGDHVLLTFSACGRCVPCEKDLSAYCSNIWDMNFRGARADGTKAYTDALDGTAISSHFFGQSSFGKKAIVRASSAIPIAQDLPLQTLCVLGCTLQTGAGTVLNQLQPPEGSSLAVFGAGAVGMAAILAGRLTPNVKIIAVDVLDSKLKIAKGLGATHTINSTGKNIVEELLVLTRNFGVERALDTTGRPDVIQAMLQATAPGGMAASVGAPKMGTKIEIEPSTWIMRGVSYIGVHQGSSRPQVVKASPTSIGIMTTNYCNSFSHVLLNCGKRASSQWKRS
jgi:aryl-alcohol dehydrogenase